MKVQQQVLDGWEKVEHAAPSPEAETSTVIRGTNDLVDVNQYDREQG